MGSDSIDPLSGVILIKLSEKGPEWLLLSHPGPFLHSKHPGARRFPGWKIRHIRNDAMVAAYASGPYSIREIAGCFGVHYVTVSRTVRR